MKKRQSKKNLRRLVDVTTEALAAVEKDAEALVSSQRRLLGEADKKLLAAEEKVQELEKTIRDKTSCIGCFHNNDFTNTAISRQFCQTCPRRAKDKYVGIGK